MSDSESASSALVGVDWLGGLDDGRIRLIDQTRLPDEVVYLEISDLGQLRQAIVDLVVRGAPAIAIAASYGMARYLTDHAEDGSPGDSLDQAFADADKALRSSRPTAVNLFNAMDRLQECYDSHCQLLTAKELAARMLMEARRIHREDAACCDAIGRNGAAVLPKNGNILTVCNTGALASGGIGTAIGALRRAHEAGRLGTVFACETRPLLQGSRLTIPELLALGIDARLVTDGMAGSLMTRGMVDGVIVGADRIAANGDTANKIGTYQLAVLAKHHSLPFYVAAPTTTFDLSTADGAAITIEERDPDEVRRPRGTAFTVADAAVANPAFDVTPAELITGIITERGVIDHPTRDRVEHLAGGTSTPSPI